MNLRISSKIILPEKKRKKASSKDLLEALVLCEKQLEDITRSGTGSMYVAINIKLIEMAADIRVAKIKIKDSESEAFENFIKLSDKIGKIVENLEGLKKLMSPNEIDSAEVEIKEEAEKEEGFVTPESMAKNDSTKV